MRGLRWQLGCALALSAAAGTGARAQTILQRWTGVDLGDRFGSAVALVGDIDADGCEDLMVGAPNYGFSFGSQVAPGMAWVLSGRTGATLYRHKGGGYNNPDIGAVVARGGDVDRDGVLDFLYAGRANGYSASTVTVRSGATGEKLYEKKGNYFTTPELGAGLVGGVDLNQDGFDDFVATAPYGLSTGSGELFAYSGADGSLLYSLQGGANSSGFGWGLACLEDIDGDAVPELVLGISGAGMVEVRSGADGAVIYAISGPVSFGIEVAVLGDVDGDGREDFAVGAIKAFSDQGRVYVHSGVDGALLFELHGSHANALFGYAIAGVGDVNGDGTPDLAVGAPFDDAVLKDAGRVTVFSGADGRELMVLYGATTQANLGTSLDGGLDLDGGGVPDLVLGMPGSSVKLAPGGEVQVLAGERTPGVYCTAKTSSLGCTPTIWSSGLPSLTTTTFTINAYSLPNEQRGVLYYGLRPASLPWKGGFECIGGPKGQRPVLSGGNSSAVFPQPDCSGSFRDHWKKSFMASLGLTPGQSVYAQFAYHDPGDPTGIGLTDALRFDVLP
jgi:hypothetical protein